MMKIIFLPGLDGTGKLFQWITPFLEGMDIQLESLPSQGPQDYAHLAELIQTHINIQHPNKSIVLVAESFSSGIALELANSEAAIKGIIFVSGFLSSPNKLALRVARQVFIKNILRFGLVRWIGRHWAFKAPADIANPIYECLMKMDKSPLLARLKTLENIHPPKHTIAQPCLYIQPRQDILITHNTLKEFAQTCSKLQVAPVDASHFVLQTKPEAAAIIIKKFVASLTE